MKQNTKSVILACAAVLSWSTVATAFKVAQTYLSGFELLLVACITSLVIFTVAVTLTKKWNIVFNTPRSVWVSNAMLGLLNPVVYYLVLFRAYKLLPAQVAQPINYMWPILLLVLLALFAGQPIPRKKYIGMFMSLGGVAIISAGSGSMEGAVSVSGLILAALSALLWASFWMINNKNKNKCDATVSLFMSFLFGSIYLLAASPFVGVSLDSFEGVTAGIYVGMFEMGIPFFLFSLAMRKTSNPALINQLCYLAPFISLFFISTVLGEKIVFTTYLGLVLIVSGIIFNEYFVKSKVKA